MSVFTKSRKARLLGGIALAATSAVILAGCATGSDSAGEETSESSGGTWSKKDLTLKIGTALPQTGTLAFLGPPEEAGVGYAAQQVNAEADSTGLAMDVTFGDSGDNDNKAYATEIPRLLSEDVQAIIGAASSGTSLQFIDQVVGAGVIQFSPANTSDAFTTYDDNGLYFRTAPSDVLQGDVLGNLIAAGGHKTLGMIVLNDSYGTGLAKYVTEAFEGAGGEVVAEPTFNNGDTTFDSQINEVLAADPDAIVLITFDEAKTIIPTLTSKFPSENIYFVDGNLANYGTEFPAGTLEGAKGTYPGLSVDTIKDFTDQLDEFVADAGDPPLKEYLYGAESFDAVVLLALASLASGSSDAADIKLKLREVSGGEGDGTKCTTYKECAEIIMDGGVADYDGVSGPITFDEVGDPTEASIGEYIYDAENMFVPFEG